MGISGDEFPRDEFRVGTLGQVVVLVLTLPRLLIKRLVGRVFRKVENKYDEPRVIG